MSKERRTIYRYSESFKEHAVLAKELLETLVEMVDNHYQTDVKKNFGQELSLDVRQSRTKK